MKLETENRAKLYFGKYKYRARLTISGLERTYSSKTFLHFLKRLDSTLSATINYKWELRSLEIEKIDLDLMERWYNWLRHYRFNLHSVLIRIEGNTAGVFSNDLEILQTLEKLDPYTIVDYSQIDETIPMGTKYFVNEPAHPFRVYLRSKAVPENFRDDLQAFIKRYENTDTVIVPSLALNRWLFGRAGFWSARYCSGSYSLDFDQESTYSLISLMFAGYIGEYFKLVKRPAI